MYKQGTVAQQSLVNDMLLTFSHYSHPIINHHLPAFYHTEPSQPPSRLLLCVTQ